MSDRRQGRGSLYPAGQSSYPEEGLDVFDVDEPLPRRPSNKPRTLSSHQAASIASRSAAPSTITNYNLATSAPGARYQSEFSYGSVGSSRQEASDYDYGFSAPGRDIHRRSSHAAESQYSRVSDFDPDPNPAPPQHALITAAASQPLQHSPLAARPPTTSGPTPMSAIADAFIDIDRNDFKACATLVHQRPDVLNENLNVFQQAARLAFASGQDDRAKRILQRLLIIKRCENLNADEAVKYIVSLDRSSSKFRDFSDDFMKLVDAVRRQNGATTIAPISTPPDTAITQPMAAMAIESNVKGKNTRRTSSSKVSAATQGPRESAGRPSQDSYQTSALTHNETNKGTSLHRGYSVRNPPEDFFFVGRVLKVLWHQPAGANIYKQVQQEKHTKGMFGEPIYSTLRWMVVVRVKSGYCLCCPISTYSNSGLTTKQIPPSEIQAHAIVYKYGTPIYAFEGEPVLDKRAMPIVVEGDKIHISPASRVHFGKFHTVEFNVKVMEIGYVPKEYLKHLTDYAYGEF